MNIDDVISLKGQQGERGRDGKQGDRGLPVSCSTI